MKNNLGLGVLISLLGGCEESAKIFNDSIGKIIKSLSLKNNILHFVFEDESKIGIYDDGQSCCETRYMSTDDNLKDFIGSKLISAEIKDGSITNANYETYEIQFLDIQTSKGIFQIANHNEHNGYYGGFSVKVVKE